MSASNLRAAVVVLTVTAVLLPRLVAQEKPVDFTLLATPAPRFDVGPTLATMMLATRGTADPERPVAHAAWVVLALIANGSTMRVGTYRAEVRAQIKWLVERQDAAGFSVGKVPCSRSEQLLAALAVTEACEVSKLPLKNTSKSGIASAATNFLSSENAPATVDEFVGTILLARCASVAKRDPDDIGQIDLARGLARSHMTAGKVRRTDAALHLDELLQGNKHPPELTVARAWPANLIADPLHTLIGALAVSVSPMTDEARAAQFETLAALVAARETEGEHAGTWAPAGGFDRTVTTAMHAITLALGNGKTPLLCSKPPRRS